MYLDEIGIEDDIHYFTIKPDTATGRRTKDNKKRRVPIHPSLIDIGFLDYVDSIKGKGFKQLFPELKVTRKNGKLADKWGSWWSTYIRKELNITRVPKPMHGFRHSFIAHCRRCKVSEAYREIIEGHTPSTVAFKFYGESQYPLSPLYEELMKLKYNGLDLSHLIRT